MSTLSIMIIMNYTWLMSESRKVCKCLWTSTPTGSLQALSSPHPSRYLNILYNMLKIFTDYLLRGFKVLIGAPEDIPNSFGSSVIKLSPGHEHNLMITPTFIRFDCYCIMNDSKAPFFPL